MKTPAEILVLGGTHGNEPFGIELVRSLTQDPIPNIEAIIANERAAAIGKRFIHTNLNCEIHLDDNSYEARRVRELIGQCARFGLILDFHNAVNETRQELYLPHITEEIKGPARWLLDRSGIQYAAALSGKSPLYNELRSTLSVELGMPSNNYPQWEEIQLQRWRHIISDMAKTGLNNLDAPLGPTITFIELVHEPSRKEAEQANLDALPKLEPYDTLPLDAQHALALPDGEHYRVLSSNYQNMSSINPKTGQRTHWGSITRDVEPFL